MSTDGLILNMKGRRTLGKKQSDRMCHFQIRLLIPSQKGADVQTSILESVQEREGNKKFGLWPGLERWLEASELGKNYMEQPYPNHTLK